MFTKSRFVYNGALIMMAFDKRFLALAGNYILLHKNAKQTSVLWTGMLIGFDKK